MCPYFDPSSSKCRVTPWDSAAYQEGSFKEGYCESSSGGYKECGNYEAAERNDYKIER
ncbi:MAG: hypothetical protein FWG63_09935 [Defluviitaleaceae bacterium]|nr:hypothetical protein [Defluviitaleaceae bacterium]